MLCVYRRLRLKEALGCDWESKPQLFVGEQYDHVQIPAVATEKLA
jgi:hypothetical protein